MADGGWRNDNPAWILRCAGIILHPSSFILLIKALLVALIMGSAHAQSFDHEHKAWTALLQKHVVPVDGGKASQVRYAGFQRDRGALKEYLGSLSRVSPGEFESWSKAQRMAFLVNSYNAFMIEKVLARYPDLRSIWDYGKVFGNPFKDRFFMLLGEERSLDWIEHETLRKPGAYDEPRVHYAVNCASVGCPMLREEAYVAGRLAAQLEDQARRFLSDRSRNRYEPKGGRLEVSRIFDWYRGDWAAGYRGIDGRSAPSRSREQYFAGYAALLADRPEHRKAIEAQKAPLAFLDYDWRLNDVKSQ
jgi:hypothetical protein